MKHELGFPPPPNESLRIQDRELAHLGALVMEAAMRPDLANEAELHAATTGVENPNSFAPNRLRIGEQLIPESSDNLYRHINEAGVIDLAVSGVVRGAKTAGAPAKTVGHTAFWNEGETGKGSTLGQGYVIEAPVDAAATGWVTADQVTGVYGRDQDGEVKNIIDTNIINSRR